MDTVKKTKQWFLSKTILIAGALIALNGLFLLVTYVSPVFETANSQTPITPFSIGALLALNIAFDAVIIYTRKIADTKIA